MSRLKINQKRRLGKLQAPLAPRETSRCQQRFASRPKCTILAPQHSATCSIHVHKIQAYIYMRLLNALFLSLSISFLCLHIYFFFYKSVFYYDDASFAIKHDASLSNRCHTIDTDL